MSQAPHGEVEEPSAPWLHAEDRALLQHKGMLSKDRQEINGVIAANVTHEGIEGAPARGMQGHREDDRRIVLRYPAELAEGLPIILDVFNDVEGAKQVKTAVGKRQGGDLAEHCQSAMSIQTGESRSADIHKGRTSDGEPRMQARSDLESRRCRSCKRGKQRPGVEALWRNDKTRRPERVVELSVDVCGLARRVLRTSCRYRASAIRSRDPRNSLPTELTRS